MYEVTTESLRLMAEKLKRQTKPMDVKTIHAIGQLLAEIETTIHAELSADRAALRHLADEIETLEDKIKAMEEEIGALSMGGYLFK